MVEEFNNEELFEGVVPTPNTEDVSNIEEVVETPAEEATSVVEEAPKKKTRKRAPKVTEEVPTPAPEATIVEPKATKASAAVTKNEEGRTPGMYYQGKKISKIPARLGSKWTVVIDGKRHKVLKKHIEIVK